MIPREPADWDAMALVDQVRWQMNNWPQFRLAGPRRDTMLRRIFVEEIGGEWVADREYILTAHDEVMFQMWKSDQPEPIEIDPLAQWENECERLDW